MREQISHPWSYEISLQNVLLPIQKCSTSLYGAQFSPNSEDDLLLCSSRHILENRDRIGLSYRTGSINVQPLSLPELSPVLGDVPGLCPTLAHKTAPRARTGAVRGADAGWTDGRRRRTCRAGGRGRARERRKKAWEMVVDCGVEWSHAARFLKGGFTKKNRRSGSIEEADSLHLERTPLQTILARARTGQKPFVGLTLSSLARSLTPSLRSVSLLCLPSLPQSVIQRPSPRTRRKSRQEHEGRKEGRKEERETVRQISPAKVAPEREEWESVLTTEEGRKPEDL